MLQMDARTSSNTTVQYPATRDSLLSASTIINERQWRILPAGCVMASSTWLKAARWSAASDKTQETYAETPDDCHIVKIVMRNMNIGLFAAGRTVRDGLVTPGFFHITEPGAAVRCIFRGSYDVLHLYVSNNLIAECASQMPGVAPRLLSSTKPGVDPVIGRLGRALIEADLNCSRLGPLYGDSIGIAIVTRLLGRLSEAGAAGRRKVTELVPWRLKRAIDYVEINLTKPVRLADVASAAGLTSMHFAAQFRVATGLQPHEYMLRRRIERAQEMLAASKTPLVEIALSVGFQSQSHFTTVFSKFVGTSPRVWRLSQT